MDSASWAQKNCDAVSSGRKPLTDVTGSTWNGVVGGLYPDASNDRPYDQHLAFQEHALGVHAVRADGTVDKVNGKIVVLGVGSSDAKVIFDCLADVSLKDSIRNRTVRFVNGCRTGLGVQQAMLPLNDYWDHVATELADSGYTSSQVQIAWVMIEDTDNADTAFPRAARELANKLYMLSAGQSLGLASPRDYINAWGAKMLVEGQISRKVGFAYEGIGAVIPAVTWSAYLWADGDTPNSDGLSWTCEDFQDDGITPSLQGAKKAGALVHASFINDESATGWFTNKTAVSVDESLCIRSGNGVVSRGSELVLTSENSEAAVSDIQGRCMWRGHVSGELVLSTVAWPPALYVVRVGTQTTAIVRP
ncbi:MAG: hypothetical protein NTX15_02425 [Candidatus Kapabacteria bacterium]|nr:hypothetical protein [Candidatus Kapabacteria bacterium]